MEAACGGAAGCVAAARTCCSRARGCARTFRWCGPNPSSVLPALTTDARLALPQVLPQGAADLCAPYGVTPRDRCRHDRRVCTSRTHGQLQGSNFVRLLLARWPACERARAAARPTTRQPPLWCSRPPPAARHTRCAGNGLPLCLYAAMSLRRYVATPLCRYAAMSLRRYVATPLCLFAATSLRREMRTRVCDGRALRMRVMAVQRCTGVGTCVARPRPQSPFANGWASGS